VHLLLDLFLFLRIISVTISDQYDYAISGKECHLLPVQLGGKHFYATSHSYLIISSGYCEECGYSDNCKTRQEHVENWHIALFTCGFKDGWFVPIKRNNQTHQFHCPAKGCSNSYFSGSLLQDHLMDGGCGDECPDSLRGGEHTYFNSTADCTSIVHGKGINVLIL
jgi:hypothetical protein